MTDRAPIPSALRSSRSSESLDTPLPVLPLLVLSITMLGEFLSANVATPFLFSMVEGFGSLHGEAEIGFWTGILVSSFFITQFLSSLLWITIAGKHGVRTVLFVSLMGSSLTCILFGTATSLQQAITIRLLQGVFAGAIGVARGNVAAISNPANEGRAYAILGFCWGFGGVAGAIIGGSFETPARKWPNVFTRRSLLVKYPYLLPTLIAASVTFSGAIMSLLLARDGGPREGSIRVLPGLDGAAEEGSTFAHDDTEETSSGVRRLTTLLSQGLLGCFGRRRIQLAGDEQIPETVSRVPLSPSMPVLSRMDRGSAYGYRNGSHRRTGSYVRPTLAGRRGSLANTVARRRSSVNDDSTQPTVQQGRSLNLAQRLLVANELAVTNLSDLWVAAAVNVDNVDNYEETANVDDLHADLFSDFEDDLVELDSVVDVPAAGNGPSLSQANGSQHQIPNGNAHRSPRFFGNSPSIFTHVGVRTPRKHPNSQMRGASIAPVDALPNHASRSQGAIVEPEKLSSPIRQLPLLVIMQYGMLALHSTTHDQVFLSFLVSKYAAGGLNLNPAHFAQLIAMMSLAQIAYQFYLYPNMGPPRGRFSHLSMFRLGTLLFIPSYLSVILYRSLASANNSGNIILMAALALSTAVRFCASCFSYTSISILLNYTAPPHLLGLANGLAQSIVSLARFVGPILGGLLWSMSVDENPSGYPLGFLVCAGVAGTAIAMSFMIR